MRRLFIIVLAGILLCSCEPDSPEIGADFFNDGVLDFSYIDSSSVKLSTIRLEPLNTYGASRMLIGSHADEKLGRITASSYFQLVPSSSGVDLEDENVSYEYLALVLKYDHYFYYDTTSSVTLDAYYVNEELELDEDGTLSSDETFELADSPLGSITFRPGPHRNDSIEIKLSDNLGLDLFEKAISGSDQLTSATEFLRYFNGLALVPNTTTSGCLLGFEPTPELRLYYKDKSTTPTTDKYISFATSSSNIAYTNIRTDIQNTKLIDLTDTEERLNADDTDEESYMQAGAGLLLRVDMPYLRDLRQVANFYATQAILDIYPIRQSYSKVMPLPQSLLAYKADKNNNLDDQYKLEATLQEDLDLDRDTHYTLDVTEFVKGHMENPTEFNGHGLVFTLPENYAVSADRIYAGNNGSNYKTRLRIYFVTVNNN